MPSTDTALTLTRAWSVLRRWGLWLVVSLLIGGGAGLLLSKLSQKRYTATASLLFSSSQLAQQILDLPSVSPTNSTQQSLEDTEVYLVQIGDIASRTAAALRGGLTTQTVRSIVSVTAHSDTDVVDVSATSTSPQLAARIATTYSSIFVSEQQDQDRTYYVAALAAVNRQLSRLTTAQRHSAQGLTLRERADTLTTLAALPANTVQLAAPATVPTAPSSPKKAENTVLGAVLGLLIALVLITIIEQVDQRIRTPEELERLYGVPLLGAVPESRLLAKIAAPGQPPRPVTDREAEAFQLIRAHLQYLQVERVVKVLLVASAEGADGKTTIAKGIALAAAEAGARVMVLEADLRHPRLGQHLGLDSSRPGLADVIVGSVPLLDAIQTVAFSGATTTNANTYSLSAVLAGPIAPPNASELMESDALEQILVHLRGAYDLVIVDSAPLALVSDGFGLLAKVDGIVIVGRLWHSRRDVARQLNRTLAEGTGRVLGTVANGWRHSPSRGAYTYDHGDQPATTSEAIAQAPDPAPAAPG